MEDEENGQVEQMIDDIFSSGSSTMSSMTHRESEDNAYFFQENVIRMIINFIDFRIC